jgi:hypothetical protein
MGVPKKEISPCPIVFVRYFAFASDSRLAILEIE